MNTKELLDWAEFVATKFESSHNGWTYTRNMGDLRHIRYGRDTTGYNSWPRRLGRALSPRRLMNRDSFSRALGFKWSLAGMWAHIRVSLQAETNLPDGVVNEGSIITFWEEDGEYITLFGPTVGVRVLEFLKAEPQNPYAVAILAEMHRIAEEGFIDNKEESTHE